MANFRYYLKPIGDLANECIAQLLNQQGHSAAGCETQSIEVKGKKVTGVYLAPNHAFLTTVGHSQHKKNVLAFVQEGEGEIRPYFYFPSIGRKLGKTAEIKRVKNSIEKIVSPRRL